jgi:hypothetical protein
MPRALLVVALSFAAASRLGAQSPVGGTAPAVPEPALPSSAEASAVNAPGAGPLADILQRAADYVLDYEQAFSNLVTEETYTQDVEHSSAGLQSYGLAEYAQGAPPGAPRGAMPYTIKSNQRQVTRADLVFVRLAGPLPWASYRDVFEVNGHRVRDHTERLLDLFTKPSPDSHERARALLDASAQYNIGRVTRTMNLPTLPLLFLLPANQRRFTFELGGKQTIGAMQAREVLFREVARPTLVSGPKNADLPTSGRFWISPSRGAVLRSEVHLDFGPEAEAVITADYRAEPELGMFVPIEMRERYADLPRAKVHTFSGAFEGVARYGNFRHFSVQTQEQVSAPSP